MGFLNTILSVFSTRIVEKFIRQINSIIISRSLGPGGVGLYTLFFALAKNLYTFSEFGMGASGIYFMRRKISKEKKVIENAVVFSLSVGIILALIVFVFRKQLGSFLLDDQGYYIFLLSLVIPMIMLASIFSILMRGLKQFNLFNFFTILKPLCFLIFIFIGLVVYNGDLIIAISGQIVAILLSGFWIIYKMNKVIPFKFRFHKKTFIQNIRYGIKQHFLKIVIMFLATSPIYILKGLTTKEIVGQYGIILTLLGLISFIKMSISLVLTPEVSELKGEKVHLLIAQVTRNTFFIVLLAAFIATIIGPFYIDILYGEKFQYASKAFKWFLPGIIFHSVSVMLHRDFTARENPVQYKPIIAYSLGAIISIFGSYFLLVNFSSTPLEAIGTAYNFSYFITFLVLMIMFICDSKLKINQVLIINRDDIHYYKKIFIKLYSKFKQLN